MNKPNQTKTHRYREQNSGYQRGRGREEGKISKLYGDGWKIHFWW